VALGDKGLLGRIPDVYCVSICVWCMQAKSCSTSRPLCSEAAVALGDKGLLGRIPVCVLCEYI
jgi:hypothetical protein